MSALFRQNPEEMNAVAVLWANIVRERCNSGGKAGKTEEKHLQKWHVNLWLSRSAECPQLRQMECSKHLKSDSIWLPDGASSITEHFFKTTYLKWVAVPGWLDLQHTCALLLGRRKTRVVLKDLIPWGEERSSLLFQRGEGCLASC